MSQQAELFAVGFHGDADPERTPMRAGPILVDGEDRICIVRGMEGGAFAAVETSSIVLHRDTLEGTWTRTRRWPARAEGLYLILGPNERFRLDKLSGRSHSGESDNVSFFLRWMEKGTIASESISAERQRSPSGDGDLFVWYCSPADAAEIVGRLAAVYAEELIALVREGDANKVQKAAFRLWRSASSAEDVYLVAAALKKVGYRQRRWEELLREGAREASAE